MNSKVCVGCFYGGEIEPGTFCDSECPPVEIPGSTNEDEMFLVENGAGCQGDIVCEF